jgi:hypothetical protein
VSDIDFTLVTLRLLENYDSGPAAAADRLLVWKNLHGMLTAHGHRIHRAVNGPIDCRDDGTANRYRTRIDVLDVGERIHLLIVTAPDLSDVDWLYLLAEFINYKGAAHA